MRGRGTVRGEGGGAEIIGGGTREAVRGARGRYPGGGAGRSGAVQLGHGGAGGSRFVPAAGRRSPGAPSGFRGCSGAGGVGPRPGEPHRRAHGLQRRLRAAHGKGRAPPPRLCRVTLPAPPGGPRLASPVPGCPLRDTPPRTLLQSLCTPAPHGGCDSLPASPRSWNLFCAPPSKNFPFPESDVLVAEMVQNSRSFLFLRSPFAQRGSPHSALNRTYS